MLAFGSRCVFLSVCRPCLRTLLPLGCRPRPIPYPPCLLLLYIRVEIHVLAGMPLPLCYRPNVPHTTPMSNVLFDTIPVPEHAATLV